jgi:hypothetical protein
MLGPLDGADLKHWTTPVKRERKSEVGGNESLQWVGETHLSSVLKVSRQCPIVLPIRVKHLTGIIEV